MACDCLWRWLAWAWATICGDPRQSKRRRGDALGAAAARRASGSALAERQGLLAAAERGRGDSSGAAMERRRLGVLGQDDEEEEEEDGAAPLLPSQKAGSSAAAAALSAAAGRRRGPLAGPARIIVMRHGHRQDEADPTWHLSARRPWDPPLSAKGRAQAREAAGDRIRRSQAGAGAGSGAGGGAGGGGKTEDDQTQPSAEGVALEGDMRPTVIITSPFLRCVQTSAGVAAALWGADGGERASLSPSPSPSPGPPPGQAPPAPRWLADWRFCEVFDPRVLFGGRPDAAARAVGKPPAHWMWAGDNLSPPGGGPSSSSLPPRSAAAGGPNNAAAAAAAADNDDDAAAEAALARAMSDILAAERDAGHPLPRGVPLVPRPAQPEAWRPPRPFPEYLGPALSRYGRALAALVRDEALRGETVLVVTHGEALRQAVAMMRPGAEVFEVRHTGFVVLEPRAGAAGGGGGGGGCGAPGGGCDSEGGNGDANDDGAAQEEGRTPSGSSGSSSSSFSEGEPEDGGAQGEGGQQQQLPRDDDSPAARAERQRQRRSARRRRRRRERRESAAAAAASRAASGGGGDPLGMGPPPGWRLATKAGEHGVMWFDG